MNKKAFILLCSIIILVSSVSISSEVALQQFHSGWNSFFPSEEVSINNLPNIRYEKILHLNKNTLESYTYNIGGDFNTLYPNEEYWIYIPSRFSTKSYSTLGQFPDVFIYGLVKYENNTLAPNMDINVSIFHSGSQIFSKIVTTRDDGTYWDANIEVSAAEDTIRLTSPSDDYIEHNITEDEFAARFVQMKNLTIFEKINHRPVITSSYPEQNPTIKSNESITFLINVTDIDEDELRYTWLLDGMPKPVTNNSFLFSPLLIKDYSLIVFVNDGTLNTDYAWNINVVYPNYISAFADGSESINLLFNEQNRQAAVIKIPSRSLITNAMVRIG